MKRTRHTPEQSVTKLREAEAMLAAGKSVAQVVQALGVSGATFSCWRSQYGVVDTDDPWFHFVYDDSWRIVATYRADHAGGGGGWTIDSDPKERFVCHAAGRGRAGQRRAGAQARWRPGRSSNSSPRKSEPK